MWFFFTKWENYDKGEKFMFLGEIRLFLKPLTTAPPLATSYRRKVNV